MESTALVKSLKTLTTQDIREFGRFINSEYFNKNEQLIDLFLYLKDFHPNYEGLDDESVIQNVYDGRLTKRQLTKLRSELMSLFKRFIQVEYLKQDNITPELYLLRHYNEWNSISSFASTYKALNTKFTSPDKIRDVNYQLNKFKLDTELHRFISSKDMKTLNIFFSKIEKEEKDIYKYIFNGYIEVSKELDNFYILQKIMHVCHMLNYRREKIRDESFSVAIRPEFEKYFRILMPKDSIVHQVWLEAYELLNSQQGKENTHYYQLKKSLEEYNYAFSVDDLRILFGYLQNATKKIFNSNTHEYYGQLFHFFDIQMRLNIFETHLSSSILRNIVTVAIVLKKIEWIILFIEKYKMQILRFKDGSYEFSKAKIEFYKISNSDIMDKKEQLQNLFSQITQNVEHKMINIHEKLNIRIIKLQISYELRTLESVLDSVNKYLNTSFKDAKTNDRLLEGNRNFKNTLHSLYKIREELERKTRRNSEKHRTDIINSHQALKDYSSHIANRGWLIEKTQIVMKDFDIRLP